MMDHQTWLSFLLILGFMMFLPCSCLRYRLCQDGCCIHEYCAYGLICYPRIHCHFGCPDGYCTGTGSTNRDKSKDTRHQFVKSATTNKNTPKSWAYPSGQITENYSYSDRLEIRSPPGINGVKQTSTNENSRMPEGICMPLPPCKKSNVCGMGHSCSHNFNLGYNVCQYNLDIGTTLCYDTHGKFAVKPMH